MNENQEITLTLSVNEVNIILQGLGEVPAKTSMQIIQKIQSQAAPQLQTEPESIEE